MSNQLFITIKYGENKEEIFNPHCKSLLLLDCIREKCHYDEETTLDLVDELGAVSYISDKNNLSEYASQFLEGRKKYILIKITKPANSSTEPNKYESLLGNIEKLYPDLAEKLDRLSKPAQFSAKGKNWHGARKKATGMSISKSKSPKRNSIVKL